MVYLAVAAGAALGGFIQSITGFGAAVMMMTVLPHFFDMTLAPSISTTVCLGLSATLTWRFRRKIDWHICLVPTVCYAVAGIVVIELIGAMDLRFLTILFGAFLVALGAFMLLRGKKTVRVTPALSVICGLAGGVSGGLFSIGGPIMAIYYLAATDDRESYIANAQINYAVTNITSLTVRIANGYYSWTLLPLSFLGIAGVVLGQKLGLKLGGRLDADQLRVVVYCYVIFSGLLTIAQQLL